MGRLLRILRASTPPPALGLAAALALTAASAGPASAAPSPAPPQPATPAPEERPAADPPAGEAPSPDAGSGATAGADAAAPAEGPGDAPPTSEGAPPTSGRAGEASEGEASKDAPAPDAPSDAASPPADPDPPPDAGPDAPPSITDAPGSDPHDHARGQGPHADPSHQLREPSATPPPTASAAAAAAARPITFTASLQVYLRGQSRFNRDQSPEPGDRQHDILERVRAGILAAAGPLRAFVQFQDARSWGFEASTIANEANTDLHQGYLELGGGTQERGGFARVGRQEINLGSRRFFADRNWSVVGQSFDGVRLHGALGRFSAELLGVMLAPPRDFTIVDPEDPTQTAAVHTRGSYAGMLLLSAALGAAFKSEVSIVGVSERPTPAAPALRRDILNAGARVFGEFGPGLRYDVEAYGQVGDNLGLPHRAVAAWGELGYVARALRVQPGVFGRYSYASGSRCAGAPADGCGEAVSHDFHRFFGARHAYHGIVDRAGLTNLSDVELGGALRPHAQVDLSLDYHFFQLAQPTGRWIGGQNDNPIGEVWDPTNSRRNLGQEIDLLLHYRPLPQLSVRPVYGVFIPLAAGRRLAGPAAQHFAYLWMIANF